MREHVTAYFKDAYDRELYNLERLNKNVQFHGTLYVILGGIVVYYCDQLIPFTWNCWYLSFYVPFAAGLAFAGFSLRYFIPSTFKLETSNTKRSVEMFDSYQKALKKHPPPNADKAYHYILDGAESQYALAADHNRRLYQQRVSYHFKTLRYIVLSLIFLIAALPGHLYIRSEAYLASVPTSTP
ncbi:MAG: hypothetical protein Q7Q73_02540 [Verrucomicrobiota bacterium JB024]|nr:hypothetical protein [Verrucomicrobiota bacterium JB024]